MWKIAMIAVSYDHMKGLFLLWKTFLMAGSIGNGAILFHFYLSVRSPGRWDDALPRQKLVNYCCYSSRIKRGLLTYIQIA
jgi:hypothetical protein